MESLSKQAILAEVERLAKHDSLTLDELTAAYAKGAPEKAAKLAPAPASETVTTTPSRVTNLTNALYIAGACIVIVALMFTIAQNWNILDAFSRILLTLGLGLGLTAAAFMWLRNVENPNKDVLGNSVLSIGSFAILIGGEVVLFQYNSAASILDATGVLFVITVLFSTLYFLIMRNVTWLLFSLFAATLTVYAAATWYKTEIVGSVYYSYSDGQDNFYPFLTASIGIAYILLSRLFKSRAVAALVHNGVFQLGSILILSGLLWVTFTESLTRGEVFDLLYPIAVAGLIYLSAYWRMRSTLFICVLFLSIYIFEICYEYFAKELGGSFALLIAGGIVMALAYVTAQVSKTYFKR